jgi:hypothetical protein
MSVIGESGMTQWSRIVPFFGVWRGDLDRNEAVGFGNLMGLDGALAGLVAFAGVAVKAEGVEGADDLVAGEHAFGEGAVLVGAAVVDGEEFTFAGAEDGDGAAVDIEGAAEAEGEFIEWAKRDDGGFRLRFFLFHYDVHGGPFG